MPTTDQPADVATVATAILDSVTAGFADLSIDLPARQTLIAGALPAWDTDQLTVALQRVFAGLPGAEQGAATPWQHGTFTAVFEVQLVRKARATLAGAPRKQMPSVTQLAADAAVYMRDVRALAGALHTAKRTGSIRTGQGKVKVAPVRTLEQQGEYLGIAAEVQVALF